MASVFLYILLLGFAINSSQLWDIFFILFTISSEVDFMDLIASEAANTSLYRSLKETI